MIIKGGGGGVGRVPRFQADRSKIGNTRVLIVDDDPLLRKFIGANLEARHHKVSFAENGARAMEILSGECPDLIILDIMMPYLDGYEVCRRVRERSSVPIIMLSAKDGQNDKLRCLELGADDYLTKPFSLSELLWRVKVLLRRTQNSNRTEGESSFFCRDLEIDYGRQRVYLKGQDVNLTKTEYKILAYLAMNAGRIVAPQHILEKVWGQEYLDKHRMLWVNVCRLRRKLNRISQGIDYIQTRSGMGYLLIGSGE